MDLTKSWIKPFSNRRFQTKLVDSEFTPHKRECHIVAYIKQGEVALTYREKTHIIKQGEALVIPAGELHSFHTKDKHTPVILFHYIDTLSVLNSDSELLMPVVKDATETKSVAKQFSPFLFEQLDSSIEESEYNQWLIKFIACLSDSLDSHVKSKNIKVQTLVDAKTYIQSNLNEAISLTELSKELKIDKWQLSRKFKPVFGVTLFQHIHASRVVKAKEMLSQRHSITDVALECGFCDQSHLTRYFKRFAGMSPNKWVKLVENSQSLYQESQAQGYV